MKVQEALTEVMRALPAIGKGGTAAKEQGGYAYRGIEQITREVQPLLGKFGVVISPLATLISIAPAPGMKEAWQDTVLSVRWNIIGPEGDAIEAQTIGIGRDSGDKGANKAMSQAFKYLMLDLFCISDAKDDSDGADYSAGHRDESPPVKSAGALLFERLTTLSPDAQSVLRSAAKEKGRKLSENDFNAHPDWLDHVVFILDGESQLPLDSAAT